MKRAEALRRIGDLHRDWSLKHGDSVPVNPQDIPAGATDAGAWNADLSAPAELQDDLNAQIVAILDQIVDDDD